MIRPQDLPDQITGLYELSKDYLRQETVEPAKALGKHAGMAFGGALALSLGGFLLMWGAYFALANFVFDGEWGRVWAKLLTTLLAGIAAGIVIFRMQKPEKETV